MEKEETNLYRIPKIMVQDILNFLNRVQNYENGIEEAYKMVNIVELLKNPIIEPKVNNIKNDDISLEKESPKEKLEKIKRSEKK